MFLNGVPSGNQVLANATLVAAYISQPFSLRVEFDIGFSILGGLLSGRLTGEHAAGADAALFRLARTLPGSFTGTGSRSSPESTGHGAGAPVAPVRPGHLKRRHLAEHAREPELAPAPETHTPCHWLVGNWYVLLRSQVHKNASED